MQVKLSNDDAFTVISPTGQTHIINDPMALMIEMSKQKLLSPEGAVADGAAAAEALMALIQKATGLEHLTYAHMMQIVSAIGTFVSDLQKKIASTQTSNTPSA